MSLLDKVALEWWQALAMILVIGLLPIFKALAVILVARFVKPDIAKVALPLMFQRGPRRVNGNVEPTRKAGAVVR